MRVRRSLDLIFHNDRIITGKIAPVNSVIFARTFGLPYCLRAVKTHGETLYQPLPVAPDC